MYWKVQVLGRLNCSCSWPKVAKRSAPKRWVKCVIPSFFQMWKIIGLLLIVNMGLCQRGVNGDGNGEYPLSLQTFHHARSVVLIVGLWKHWCFFIVSFMNGKSFNVSGSVLVSSLSKHTVGVVSVVQCLIYCSWADMKYRREFYWIDWLNNGLGEARFVGLSSAYKLILYSLAVFLKPVMLSSWRTDAASGSMKTANSNGESGHPCLVPRINWKGGEICPLVGQGLLFDTLVWGI